MEDKIVDEMYKNVLLAQKEVKGYKFACIGNWCGNRCAYCRTRPVTFVTTIAADGYKHSQENNMPMWISKD